MKSCCHTHRGNREDLGGCRQTCKLRFRARSSVDLSDVRSKSEGIDLDIDVQEIDLEERIEEERCEGMSDGEEDILERYTSEASDLARALGGVVIEENSLLGSDTGAEVTVVETFNDVSDTPASAAFFICLAERGADIAIIQELWIHGDRILSLVEFRLSNEAL